MKKRIMKFLMAGFLIVFISGCNGEESSKTEKPNLIYIFTDQQSFDMLGCYGNEQIKTPNIDAFAAEGILFNHCISNTPVCSPYRGMLLSGMHPLYNGVLHNDIQMLPGDGNYFAEVLTKEGYYTGYFGKWHLYGGDRVRPIPAGPYRYGFDDEFLSNNCTLLYDSIRSYFWNEEGEKELYNDWEYNAQSRQAIDFIERNADKQIAMFLSWHAPHDWMAGGFGEHKYSAPREFEKLYDLDDIKLRENVTDTKRHRLYYQGHMAMISSLDRDFGNILDKLEEKGIADNSLIIFTSDHGDMLESHDWPYNKGRPEIESIRVPLIMKWGDNFESRKSDLLIGALDLMPTILSTMGLPVPETCQGKDLSDPIMQGDDDAVSSVPLFYFAGDWRGVYTHDYTYAYTLKEGKAEPHAIQKGFPDYDILYHHESDPYELNNLFNNPEYQEVKSKLHQETHLWMEKFNDKGVPYSKLLPAVMVEEDYVMTRKPHREREPGFETRLKGRPVNYQ